jgi:hypothetical protein
MTKASELAHLFRALKAPAAARALPKLAERAREEQFVPTPVPTRRILAMRDQRWSG